LALKAAETQPDPLLEYLDFLPQALGLFFQLCVLLAKLNLTLRLHEVRLEVLALSLLYRGVR
jgi:hypothetical protein